MKEEERIQHRQ